VYIIDLFNGYGIALEAKKTEKDEALNDVTTSGSKKIQLQSSEVEVSKVTTDDDTYLQIKYMKDPNITGFVRYKNEDDLKLAYDNLNTMGDVLNYMYTNSRKHNTAFPWSDIIAKEVISMKRDMTEDEIADVKLDFKV
jgi:hypothetical protein